MFLSELNTGESAVIIKVRGHGGFRRRILEMGFVRGQQVEAVLNAPLRDPIKYRVMGYEVSLRRSEAAMIEILTPYELQHHRSDLSTSPNDDMQQALKERINEISVALVGNPNSGKSSIFNALTGGHAHVGNYSGVTVDAQQGSLKYKGYTIRITDLPGTYALSAYTPEELYVREHLVKEMPDVVINSVVASNLERNLYLTTELIDLNPKMVVALNMYDELEQAGAKLDYEQLGRMIGVPMVPVVARDGKGLEQLLDEIILTYENENPKVRHIHINYSLTLESEVQSLSKLMKRHLDELPKCFPPRYCAIKLLEGDKSVVEMLSSAEHFPQWQQQAVKGAARVKADLDEDVESAITSEKYGFVEGALAETLHIDEERREAPTSIIDRVVTHKWLGIPLFLLLMFVMFWSTFTLGAYPQEWIEAGFGWLGDVVGAMMSEGALKDLIVNGIIGGVGSVAVFLPNILILYLFISLMEDSGYMARAAYTMDKIMHRIGLHGSSFIPMLMGFGCNVPAIMATRTLETKHSRLITMLVIPFMSCTARLPVYVLFSKIFFPEHASSVMLLLYVLGILVAVISARIFKRFMIKGDETPFVMELPPYRVPTLKSAIHHMWEKSVQYLKKMGTLILFASVIIWALGYFPMAEDENVTASEQLEQSYIGRIGKFIEPVIEPLGYNWKMGIGIVAGLPAKELVVSTLSVLYTDSDEETEESNILAAAMKSEVRADGTPLYTPATVLSYLVFILLCFPCIATIMAIKSESGSWKWALFSALYTTGVAWILAFAVYKIGGLFL